MKLLMVSTTKILRVALIMGMGSLAFWTCKYPEGPPNPNTRPTTRLANIPANDTIAQYIRRTGTFPEQQLAWLGDDPDGFVIAYQYRWTRTTPPPPNDTREWTTVLSYTRAEWGNVVVSVMGTPSSLFNVYNFLVTLTQNDAALVSEIGDSLATFRPFPVPYKTGLIPTDSVCGVSPLTLQSPTTGTFIFDSPADSNMHMFEVRSVDNNDEVDLTPAIVNFWTLVSPGSVVQIDTLRLPPPNAFAIRHPTERWPGLPIYYRSLDPNNQFGVTFSYSIDDTVSWSDWTEDNVAYVTASMFKPVVSGAHTFYVRARNRWGVISPTESRVFTATIPAFDTPGYQSRYLIINNNSTTGTISAYNPDSNMVKAFYTELMDSIGKSGQFDIWTTQRAATGIGNLPERPFLGQYIGVVFVHEKRVAPIGGGQYVLTPAKQERLIEYLNVGGKLIFSSPPNIAQSITGYNDGPGAWAFNIFHLSGFLVNGRRDLVGTNGLSGYPNMPFDTTKIHPDSLAPGTSIRALGTMSMNFPRGFAEVISRWNSAAGDPFWQGGPVGIRYLAPPPQPPARQMYSMVFYGHPLYLVQKSNAIEALRKAFIDINEY